MMLFFLSLAPLVSLSDLLKQSLISQRGYLLIPSRSLLPDLRLRLTLDLLGLLCMLLQQERHLHLLLLDEELLLGGPPWLLNMIL